MHTIGKILNAYLIYRRKIIAAHDNEVAALRHNANMEEKARNQSMTLHSEIDLSGLQLALRHKQVQLVSI